MPGVDAVVAERLQRVLGFLALGGGAALVSIPDGRVVAAVGDIDAEYVRTLSATEIEPDDAVVHVPPDALIANVHRRHRLVVRVPVSFDAAFGNRVRRARDIVERFRLHDVGYGGSSSSGGATPAPAHAVVFARRGRGRA